MLRTLSGDFSLDACIARWRIYLDGAGHWHWWCFVGFVRFRCLTTYSVLGIITGGVWISTKSPIFACSLAGQTTCTTFIWSAKYRKLFTLYKSILVTSPIELLCHKVSISCWIDYSSACLAASTFRKPTFAPEVEHLPLFSRLTFYLFARITDDWWKDSVPYWRLKQ